MRRTIFHFALAVLVWSGCLGALSRVGGRACGSPTSCAIGTLRRYAQAQEAYQTRHGRYGTLKELVTDGETVMERDGVRFGYEYEFRVTFGGAACAASATPVPVGLDIDALDGACSVSVSSGRGLRLGVGHPAGEEDRVLPIH